MSMLNIAKELEVPLELATEATAILGKRGRGKTNTAVVIVEEMIGAGIPVCVVDTVGVWWGLKSSADGQKAGLPVVVFGGDHADVKLEETAGKVIARVLVDSRIPMVIDTSAFSKAGTRRFLHDFVTEVYHRNRQALHLVFDEADEVAPQRILDRDGGYATRLLGAMEDLVRRGRARGIGVTLVTQRPAVLNKDVLTQVEVLIAMGMTGVTDVKAIDEWIKLHDLDDQAAELRASLPGLPVGTGWVWSPSWLEILKRVSFRERRTFDSSATPKIGQVRIEPKVLASVDLTKLGEEIAATVEKQKAEDPRELRLRIAELQKHLAERPSTAVELEVERVVEVPVITAEQIDQVSAVLTAVREVFAPLALVAERLEVTVSAVEQSLRAAGAPTPRTADAVAGRSGRPTAVVVTTRPVRQPSTNAEASGDLPELRAGARRMVETLGRMHPLRLTKAQWGTVSHMKTSSGTWSTYIGDIRKRGFLDENEVGFTLTPAGFEYLGGQPEPMTPEELQAHYRKILRAGAVRMLDVIMGAYPRIVGREPLAEAVEMSSASGTFSTYLGDLTRNGLVERVDGGFVATDVLMHGAAA